MLSIVKSMALQGLEGYLIDVQVNISTGLPYWEIVGLPDACVKESKERVKIAIQNSGFEIRSKRVIVNLAPAMRRKEGTRLDLPIAIGILSSMGIINGQNFEDTIFIGELSLDGTINKINGVLPICIEAVKIGIKRVVLPIENVRRSKCCKWVRINCREESKRYCRFFEWSKEKEYYRN